MGELGKLRKAGEVAAEVRRWTEAFVGENMRVIDICEAVEAEIIRRGGKPAFPCNVDINDVAAHYTSPPNDESRVPPSSIVKVDIGVHVDGYIADTATTVCFNYEHLSLKQATDEALEAALNMIKPGVKLSEIGASIQHVIEGYGFKPIRNLTGHGLSRFKVHTGKAIPNVSSIDGLKVEEGEVYAIEPFATTSRGAGEIAEYGLGFIYRVHKEKTPKDEDERKLIQAIKENFYSLPFALRWAVKVSPVEDFEGIFGSLLRKRYVVGYPMLVERLGQPIAQSEHTVVILKNGAEVVTL